MYYLILKLAAAVLAIICCLLSSDVCGQAVMSAADVKSDLQALRRIVEESHPDPYRSADKKQVAERWSRALKYARRPMTKREFLNFVAPLLTQYRDGHTAMDLPLETDIFNAYTSSGGKFFPLSVSIIGNRLYVSASHGENKVAPGAEILEINKKSAKELLKELRPITMGDNDAGRDVSLARLFGLYLWQRYEFGNSLSIKLRPRQSARAEAVTLSGLNWDAYSKLLFAGDPVRSYELTPQVYVLEVNKMQGRDAVKKQIDEIFETVRTKNYSHLVIDLRKNGGGSSVVGDWVLNYVSRKPFSQGGTKEVRISGFLADISKYYAGTITRLKERFPTEGDRIVMKYTGDDGPTDENKWVFPGNVIMLTSPRTYSSGFMMAEAFKCYQMGKIIGESPGSFRKLSGEMTQFTLPKSGLAGYVATAQFKPPCFQKSPTDFLEPDVTLGQTAEDLAAGRDTHLEYIKELAEKGRAAAGKQ
ncbi:MAG: S41 family peptidase [Pyrinomonadaceae bacterium]|nr:S41 family peptidase [Pyrinomonadaceae bacterium]